MGKEVQSHTENEVWELVPRPSVPPGTKILPAVLAMKRKRRIATREVYKWKARLNIDGSKQEEEVNYRETFSPVTSLAAIRIVLITALIHAWNTKQINFVLVFTQTEAEYLAIFTATCKVLPHMELIQEMQKQGCGLQATTPHLHCCAFQDNSGFVKLATNVKNPKMRTRTRHINTKHHHIANKVQDGTISIFPVSTTDMLADILTKVCNEEIHTRLREKLMGW
jgi:hypothetical protein